MALSGPDASRTVELGGVLRLAGRLMLTALSLHPVWCRNLAPEASYEVTVWGHVYRSQTIPGTNTPATAQGFLPAPPWQGPADTLTDGRRDGDAVVSWFWSQMDKRITARFDLRRPAAVAALRVWPRTDAAGYDAATARIAASAEALSTAPELQLAVQPDGAVWSGEAVEGRFIEITCHSSAPQMTLAEVEIEGESTGDVVEGAPEPGLVPDLPRDLAPLVALPQRPPGVDNMAAGPAASYVLTSRHYDDKTGQWGPDDCAAAADPTGRSLTDGDRTRPVRSFSGWYAAKQIDLELDLGRPVDVHRIVVWSADHGRERSYVNCVKMWLKASVGAPWEPVGDVYNPVLPAEVPAEQYPIIGPVLERPAVAVRLELTGVAQSADYMAPSEVEIWGRPRTQPVPARSWRVLRPAPAIAPVPRQELDPAYSWLLSDRLRGLYCYVGQWADGDLLDRAVAAGFNSLIVHTMGPSHSEAGWPEEAAEWARVQDERGLRVVVSWPFGSDERYGNTQFGAYQPGGATTWQRGPCPLSREYWDRVVGDRAQIAAEAGLTGLVVDMEMYGADATRYPGPCYCDTCWGRFVGEYLEGVSAMETALPQRPAWIAANDLSQEYSRWQELEVMAILSDIRDRVRKTSPAFLLGNLLDPESLPGLARGLGTATMPALVFSELEYGGNIAGLPGRLARLAEEGYPVWYVPGLALNPVTPGELPGLVKAMGPPSGGFWVWSSAALAPDARPPYAHAEGFSHDDYWEAFGRANAALSRALGADAGR